MTELNGWQIVTVLCALIGAGLAAVRMYFPPQHVVDAEEKRPRVIGCEAGQHITRLHERTDRQQDSMAKVSEALVKLTAILDGLAANEVRRETESREFHRETHNNFASTHRNQIEIRETVDRGLSKLTQMMRPA